MGFGLHALPATVPLAMFAVGVWTVGEILGATMSPSVVADLAPAHLRGSGYAGAARLGHGKGYQYAHDAQDAVARQQYLPDDLHGATDYYRPTGRGFEERLAARWSWLKTRLGRD